MPSKVNWAAEKYEKIGSENPAVGIALSWKVQHCLGMPLKYEERTPYPRITPQAQIPAEEESDYGKNFRKKQRVPTEVVEHSARQLGVMWWEDWKIVSLTEV